MLLKSALAKGLLPKSQTAQTRFEKLPRSVFVANFSSSFVNFLGQTQRRTHAHTS